MNLLENTGRFSIKSALTISVSWTLVLVTRKVTSFEGNGLVLFSV